MSFLEVCAVAAGATAIALLSASAMSEGRKRRWWRAALRQSACEPLPPVTLIVPVKGWEQGLKENLAALAGQDYPDFELIVCAWTAQDIPEGAAPPGARLVLAAGQGLPFAPETGEKIRNLAAAVRAARSSSEILVFADSDGAPPSRWLAALVSALLGEDAGAATGFRVYIPCHGGLWSWIRSAWDAVILENFTSSDARILWGGAVAVRRCDFERWRILDWWNGAVSDDYRLAAAVRAHGRRMVFVPGALTPTFGAVSAIEFLGWIRRQMLLTRIYRPALFWSGTAVHLLYCAALVFSAAALATGAVWAALPLCWQLGAGAVKAWRRAGLVEVALPELVSALPAWRAAHAAASPLLPWLWLWAFVAAIPSRRMRWRGIHYRLQRLPEPPPAGVW